MIEFKNVTIAYKNHIVLKNLNLVIENNEKIFILGPSGAGKSSFFRVFSNPKLIIKGKVLINDKNIKTLKPRQLSKLCQTYGLLNQETLLIENISTYENIKLFYPKYQNKLFAFLKILTKIQKQEIWEIFQKLDLSEYIFTRTSNLSGGQKRRVEIALILLQKAQIILADEPTTGLDIKNSQNIINLLDNLNQTLLINLHKLELLDKPHHRVLAFKNQKLAFDKKRSELKGEDFIKLYD